MFSFRLPTPTILTLAFLPLTVSRRGPTDEQDRRFTAIVDHDLLEPASQERTPSLDAEQGQPDSYPFERSPITSALRPTSWEKS